MSCPDDFHKENSIFGICCCCRCRRRCCCCPCCCRCFCFCSCFCFCQSLCGWHVHHFIQQFCQKKKNNSGRKLFPKHGPCLHFSVSDFPIKFVRTYQRRSVQKQTVELKRGLLLMAQLLLLGCCCSHRR